MKEKIIAKVGNNEITVEDVKRAKMYMPKEYQQILTTQDGKKEFLNKMVIQEMIYLNALENNMDAEEAFIKEMDLVKADKLKEYAIQKIFNNISIEEEEANAFYEENKENFKTEETFRARHILLDNEEDAKKLLLEIKNGKDFSEAAKEFSKCPSKENGGDLGFFSKGKMVPEFEEAVFKLEVGELGDIVQTQFGYHIVILDEKKAPEDLSFDQVKDKIKDYLLNQAKGEAFSKAAEKLRGKYDIDVNVELLNVV